MFENTLWLWLLVGLLPYTVKRTYLAGGVNLIEIRALTWSLHIRRRPSERNDWTIRIPLIEQFRTAFWSAIEQFRPQKKEDDSAQD